MSLTNQTFEKNSNSKYIECYPEGEINKSQNINNINKVPNFLRPIGIYNFNSSQQEINSLEENIDNEVKEFIELNKDTIIRCVINEVERKLNEKIKLLNNEISSIKNDFNCLYEGEFTDFKNSDILNVCQNSIQSINNKIIIMKENINKYTTDINSFNISITKFNLLNSLNQELEAIINEAKINQKYFSESQTNENNNNTYQMDIDDGYIKHLKVEENEINQKLNEVFNETESLIQYILEGNYVSGNNNKNNESINKKEEKIKLVSDNFYQTFTNFNSKFDLNPINNLEKQKERETIKKEYDNNSINRNINSIPDFFN